MYVYIHTSLLEKKVWDLAANDTIESHFGTVSIDQRLRRNLAQLFLLFSFFFVIRLCVKYEPKTIKCVDFIPDVKSMATKQNDRNFYDSITIYYSGYHLLIW